MYRLFPRRERPDKLGQTLLSVFLIFMPVGFQLELIQPDPLSWTRGLAGAVMTGAISVLWCTVGMFRMWWFMLPIALMQGFVLKTVFVFVERSGIPELGAGMSRRGESIVLVILSNAALAIGFALLMRGAIFAYRTKQAARAELDIARRVHESIVPPISFTAPGVEILARSRTSSTMGGDLIDVITRDGEVDVFLADVSGHGVKAGIVMAMLKASVRTRLASGGPLGEILQDVNRVLAGLSDPSMFATLACLRVRGGGIVEYALAGHLPILHVTRAGELRELPNQSLPLGIEPGERYSTGKTAASPGDVLVLMTDGLVEVQGKNGRQLGLGALSKAFREAPGGSVEAIHSRVMALVDAHGAQLDDQTLALVRIA